MACRGQSPSVESALMSASNIGGSAAARGFSFQHSVTAWVSSRILAETGSSPPWGLKASTTLEWLRAETEQPVDDLLVGTSQAGLVFCQIKRSISLSQAADSELGSVIAQFVRQFLSSQARQGNRPWDRPLAPDSDRLVLVCGPTSSAAIRVHLRAVLERLRGLQTNQPIDESATTQAERRAWAAATKHARAAWQATAGSPAVEENLRRLFSLTVVQVLDVEAGGTDERQAQDVLRASVLKHAGQAATAWNVLVNIAADLAARKSGIDRPRLQDAILGAGIPIAAAVSYRADIERLQRYSRATLGQLLRLSTIEVQGRTVKVHRNSTSEITALAKAGSVVVVGQPGAGKSGALHDLAESLCDDSAVMLLGVDRIDATTLGHLRQDLGLAHEVVDVLANWPGEQPAFLIVDALDAARTEPAARTVRELMRCVSTLPRWRVVASIRNFDLRYSHEVREMFAGAPSATFFDPEFHSIRHVLVPPLSDGELAEIEPQSAELYSVLRALPSGLREVLFNVRILAELLNSGVAAGELTPITTQLELLDRYWSYRVIDIDGGGDARETLLGQVTDSMVRNRILQMNRADLTTRGTELTDLLSRNVLIEWQRRLLGPPDRQVLAFAHHVLFDYGVARLLFRGDDRRLLDRLASDPELVLVVRPSLVFHFNHLWMAGGPARKDFWNVVFLVLRLPNVPEVGKLVGPSAAAALSLSLEDLQPLLTALGEGSGQVAPVATEALRHVVGSLLVSTQPLVGPSSGPWCALAQGASERLTEARALVYELRSLLSALCDQRDHMTDEQMSQAGLAARRLLEAVWSRDDYDRWLIPHALQCVCRTFESDSTASGDLLRRALQPAHLSQYGFNELPWLAREVSHIVPLDPSFVEDLFVAAFSYDEASTDATPMGSGRILALTSNRRQDYELALWELAHVFPTFLKRNPVPATRALIAALESHARRRGRIGLDHDGEQSKDDTFDFDGVAAHLITDYSHIWDRSPVSRHDDPVQMLDSFHQHLRELSADERCAEQRSVLIRTVAERNRVAVVWRRLLLVGREFPQTLGKELRHLASAVPLLINPDTSHVVGDFLREVFAVLSSNEREGIERAILSLPCVVPDERRKFAELVRDRLLGCLPLADVTTEEARSIQANLIARGAVPSNEPAVTFGELTSRPFGEEEHLAELGVPVNAEPNRRIRELEAPLNEFAKKYLNGTPARDEAEELQEQIQGLWTALRGAAAESVHQKQRDHAWGVLAEACGRIPRIEELSCADRVVRTARDILLEASAYPDPPAEYGQQFDEHLSWGSPAARIDAAEGLILFARHESCVTRELLAAVQSLVADPVPAVRYQIACRLNAIYRTAPDLMWRLAEHFVDSDESRGVLQGLGSALDRLAPAEPAKVIALVNRVLARVSGGPGAEEVRRIGYGILAGLYIWRGDSSARVQIDQIRLDPLRFHSEAMNVLFLVRDALTFGPTDPSDTTKDAVRARAFDFTEGVLGATISKLREVEHTNGPFDSWPKVDQDVARTLAGLVDAVAREVYFASGSFKQSEKPTLGTRERLRFYGDAAQILDQLADVGLPSVAHHLLEILESYVDVDPRGVFIRIGRVVRGGKRGGYQYESLAADLMVRLIERYLAEYRWLFREDDDCRRALLDGLDAFVSAGWPSARRLAYRLEEIFR